MNLIAKWILVLTVVVLYVGWLIGIVSMNRKAREAGKMRSSVGVSLFIVLGLVLGGGFAFGLVTMILRF